MRTSASATSDGEWVVPLCACQEVWEWLHTQVLYTAAILLGGCVQGVGTRVARVGERCAVVWLASEWHAVCSVCSVCVAHAWYPMWPSLHASGPSLSVLPCL